jgi:hypothetical protein
MCFSHALVLVATTTFGFGACGGNLGDGADDDSGDAQPCEGLACYQVDCPDDGTTSVSGVVHAPNGWLRLYNVTVYVPNGPVGPLVEGVTCDRCDALLSGNPLVQTTTDTAGRFVLTDMPATGDVPLVVQVGKWRRQLTIPNVRACEDTALAADDIRLPAHQGEGDLPQMALATGGADALECLLRKIGIDDREFATAGGDGRVHLYAGNPSSAGGGTDRFDAALGGGQFAAATTLWNDVDSLSDYDVVVLSCEGSQNRSDKPLPAREALKAYADVGGRVFASHWHNYWLEAGPPPWDRVVTIDRSLDDLFTIVADINRSFPRGADLAEWLVNVEASTTLGRIDIENAQHTVTGIDETRADKWIYRDQTANGVPSVQYLSYTTPLEVPDDQRCGRVVFSDLHVSSGDYSDASYTFPSRGCRSDLAQLSPQEKVLAFMIFDIASCVGPFIP